MCGPVYILQCPNIYLMNLTSFLLPRFWVSSLLIGSHSSFSVKCLDYKVKRLAGKKKLGTRGSPQPVCITVYDTEFEAVFSRKTISAPTGTVAGKSNFPIYVSYCFITVVLITLNHDIVQGSYPGQCNSLSLQISAVRKTMNH